MRDITTFFCNDVRNYWLYSVGMDTIAKRLEFFLSKKNGGNQSELARFCGVTPQAVQKWLAGKSEPRGKNLNQVSEFLGVTPVELKFGEQKVISHSQNDVERTALLYPADIQDVIGLMLKTDERGRLKMKLAAIDAFELHNSHISRTQSIALDDEELRMIEKRRRASKVGKDLIDTATETAHEDEQFTQSANRA